MFKHRFVRFLIVGTVNTFLSYGLYAALLFVGLSYIYANLIALIAGIIYSFRSQGAFVFYNRDKRRFGRFVVSWGVIYAANVLSIKEIMELGFDPYVAGAMALPLIVVASYFIQKLFVFPVSKSKT